MTIDDILYSPISSPRICQLTAKTCLEDPVYCRACRLILLGQKRFPDVYVGDIIFESWRY
jgi:hypothetical protein